jgi:DNA-binding CsgD family transcriptional regulator
MALAYFGAPGLPDKLWPSRSRPSSGRSSGRGVRPSASRPRRNRLTSFIVTWGKLGCPYERALALADSHDEATMREAIEQLQSLGARPAAAIVARRLRERGVRGVPRGPRPQTRENPAGLTARELEVLALLAEGLRSAQIAGGLVVSEKTIDHHVSAILHKLDVRNRGGASAQAAKLGINPAPR